MSLQLTQKEKMLLKDQQKHEEICIQKYTNYAQQAQEPQLKELLNNLASQEKQHLDTINQILNGQVPSMSSGQSGQNQQQQNQQAGQGEQYYQMTQNDVQLAGMEYQQEAALLNDLLMTEKYVSNTYDTAIFECTDSNVRQVLNHIQKEEQQHGESIYNYMKSRGMYNN